MSAEERTAKNPITTVRVYKTTRARLTDYRFERRCHSADAVINLLLDEADGNGMHSNNRGKANA